MPAYYCTNHGLKGFMLIKADSEADAIIKYRNRTGRKPDLIHQEGHPIK